MNRRQRRKGINSKLSVDSREKIMERARSTYEICKNHDVEDVKNFIREKQIYETDSEGVKTLVRKCSNTDLMSLYRLVNEKIKEKAQQNKKETEETKND